MVDILSHLYRVVTIPFPLFQEGTCAITWTSPEGVAHAGAPMFDYFGALAWVLIQYDTIPAGWTFSISCAQALAS
jgi:hypothetical protein